MISEMKSVEGNLSVWNINANLELTRHKLVDSLVEGTSLEIVNK